MGWVSLSLSLSKSLSLSLSWGVVAVGRLVAVRWRVDDGRMGNVFLKLPARPRARSPVRPWSSSSAVVANASIDCDLRRSPEGCGLCAMPPGAGAACRSALSSLAAAPPTVRVNMLPWSSTTVSVRELKFPSCERRAD